MSVTLEQEEEKKEVQVPEPNLQKDISQEYSIPLVGSQETLKIPKSDTTILHSVFREMRLKELKVSIWDKRICLPLFIVALLCSGWLVFLANLILYRIFGVFA